MFYRFIHKTYTELAHSLGSAHDNHTCGENHLMHPKEIVPLTEQTMQLSTCSVNQILSKWSWLDCFQGSTSTCGNGYVEGREQW